MINNGDIRWIVNVILAVFLLVMITNWKVFFLSFTFGGIASYCVYLAFFSEGNLNFVVLKNLIFNIGWIIGVIILFNIKRSNVEEEVFRQNAYLVRE